MRKIILAVGAALGMSMVIVACGGNECEAAGDRYTSCTSSLDCSVITDANTKTACEMMKNPPAATVTVTTTVECTDALATAAKACDYTQVAPKADDTAAAIATWCAC